MRPGNAHLRDETAELSLIAHRVERRFDVEEDGAVRSGIVISSPGSGSTTRARPKIEDFDHPAAGEEHVLRLQIAMDDSPLARRGKPRRDIRRDLARTARGGEPPLEPPFLLRAAR